MIAADARTDFGDWLSPMLVKELRQGMRSRVFVSIFYVTQLLMILSVVLMLITTEISSDAGGVRFFNGLFWFLVAVPLVLVTPIRGFNALHGELKGKTMELIFLTKLSAWRIVAGKWTALMVQSSLLVCAVLPYVVLRYFLGGVDIVGDMLALLYIFLGSAALTALTIGLSPFQSLLLRIIFVAGLVVGVFMLPSLFSIILGMMIMGGVASAPVISPGLVGLGIAAYAPAFILLCFEIAATQIAPPAENHAVRKRALGAYFLVLPAALAFTGMNIAALFLISMLLVTLTVVDSMSEATPSIVRPFFQKGPLRLLNIIVTPGWQTATAYVLALMVLALMALCVIDPGFRNEKFAAFPGYFAALLFPAALIRLVRGSKEHFLGLYIAAQFLCLVLAALLGMVATGAGRDPEEWLAPFPMGGFLMSLFGEPQIANLTPVLFFSGLTIALCVLLLLLRGAGELRDIRRELGKSSGTDATA